MAETRRMGHDGPDGSTVGSRATTAGYTWRFIAENVAAGHPDAASVVAGWNRSRGHRRNMLSRDARDIGLGLAVRDGVPYWTMVVGARF